MRVSLKSTLLCAAALLCCARTASAQPSLAYPPASYYASFDLLYDGEVRDALDRFKDEIKGSLKLPDPWVDAICAHAMAGECFYVQGKYPAAIDQYNAALRLYLAYPNWTVAVQFPAALQPAAQGRAAAPWGTSRRNARLARVPSTIAVQMGRLQIVGSSTIIPQTQLYPVGVQEIWRCVALSLHRRRELLGPICGFDPLTRELVQALSGPVTHANHWSQAWVDVCLGIAQAGDGLLDQGAKLLDRGLLIGGQFDHGLTGIALLELGQIAMEKGDLNRATSMFEEASYSCFDYGDLLLVDEAFRCGFAIHLMANRQGMFPPLAKAVAWAKQKNFRPLAASLLAMAGENDVVLGQTAPAIAAVDEAHKALVKRPVGAGELGARLNYVGAIAQYQRGATKAGDDALAAALEFKRTSGRWLYQITVADGLATQARSPLAPRMALGLYEKLLRDPTPDDWGRDPLESLSVLAAPNGAAWEHYYESVLSTKQFEQALEIADRIRRARFLTTLPAAGRVLSLQWLLEAPEAQIEKRAAVQRQDVLARYPQYAEWSAQAKKVREDLAKLNLVPETSEDFKKHAQLLDSLAKVSQLQEAKLHEIAIRREPLGQVFPPIRKTQEVQRSLPDGHWLWIFFSTSHATHSFLISNQRYAYWAIADGAAVEGKLVQLLRDMGLYDGNREYPLKELATDTWKKPAKELMDLLAAGSREDPGKIEELIVVPDGLLWYLPFEALQATADGVTQSMLFRSRVRYAPMMSLATSPATATRKARPNTAVVVGKMHPRADADAPQNAYERLRKAVPGMTALKPPLPGPSAVYRVEMDGLIVLDELTPSAAYEWSPIELDKAKAAGALGNWMLLPWGSPDFVVLPGFRTRAESAFKTGGGPPGHDLFLSTCALMAAGTRTVLISRWRTGGQSSYDLVREFAKELPHATAADAWQRSVQLVSAEAIVPDQEPRVQRSGAGDPPKAEHPFFWAGYMLIDQGVPAQKQ